MEIFKDIKGYEGKYQISNHGRVWSILRQIYLKPCVTNGYYNLILITKNGKKKHEYVHRLVAINFIENLENKPQVNHIDENKLNNHIDNLEWATSKENNNHGTHNQRISEKRKKAVRNVDTNEVFDSVREAGKSRGISPSNISLACLSEGKSAGCYKWEFI